MKLNKNVIAASALTLLLVLPMAASAITFFQQPSFNATADFPVVINSVLTVVWWTFIGLTVIFFIIIAVLFLSSQGNPEAVATARRALIWGGTGVIIGILAFGIIRIVANTFGFTLTT